MFVRNCWYVIAWDHEVPEDGLFSRTVLGEAILLYRTASGEITAAARPLLPSPRAALQGRKEGDCVRCGYHGLLFDATGRCIEIPAPRRCREGARAALSARR
jgi:vanillate O-demethylase monooxygenase subunit